MNDDAAPIEVGSEVQFDFDGTEVTGTVVRVTDIGWDVEILDFDDETVVFVADGSMFTVIL